MAALNSSRVLIGAVAGTVVWVIWGTIINMVVLGSRYQAGQAAGTFLSQSRYRFFPAQWIFVLFVLSCIIAWFYASVRATRGPGPGTALQVGLLIGFCAGFPLNLSFVNWLPISRIFPLWWMLELWVGAVLAALVAGWLYRE